MSDVTQEDRLFAADLLNRAGLDFDAREVGMVAAAVRRLERELAEWVDRTPRERGRHALAQDIAAGRARQPHRREAA